MSINTVKKCPYCSVNLQLDVEECFSCKKKVGEINEYGIAKKPINWIGNIMAIISGGAFLFYMYWLFFMKGK